MGARVKRSQTPTLEVAGVDSPFFGAVVDGDDTPEGGGLLEFGEEVDNEADAGVEGDCGGIVEVLFCFCEKLLVILRLVEVWGEKRGWRREEHKRVE